MAKDEVGHNFLARLGKTRLRPGGKKATDWLIANGDFSQDKKVLEVACNMGTTAIGLAKQFGCHIEGVDLDEHALEKAQANIEANECIELDGDYLGYKIQTPNGQLFSKGHLLNIGCFLQTSQNITFFLDSLKNEMIKHKIMLYKIE